MSQLRKISVFLEPNSHKRLKILAAQNETSIQKIVQDAVDQLIRGEIPTRIQGKDENLATRFEAAYKKVDTPIRKAMISQLELVEQIIELE